MAGIACLPSLFHPWGRHTRWLTVITVDPSQFGADREAIRLALESEHIEARPVWKPMPLPPCPLPPISGDCAAPPKIGGLGGHEALFRDGLCLPAGSNLSEDDLSRVVAGVRSLGR